MKHLFNVTLLALALPVTGLAAETCTFTTECLEGEACAETSFMAEVTTGADKTATFTTDAETLKGQMLASDDNIHFAFEHATAAHLLTQYPDGQARYTVHLDGPFTITYHGSCEGQS